MAICLSRVIPSVGQVVMMTRPGLSGMVAFSAVVGYLAAADQHSWPIALILWFGIALLSGAASIFNQVQERLIDSRMERTRLRPLVTGAISIGEALLLAVCCGLIGLILLVAVTVSTALAGIFVLLLYNGLYTPLKRHTSLALFPGALSGALPVAAGWLAASGSLHDPRLYSLLIFMVLWQVPHFISLAIRERDDYRTAGLSLVPDSVSTPQLIQLMRLWTAALAIGGLQLVAIGFLSSAILVAIAIGLIFWLTIRSLIPIRVAAFEEFATAHGRRLKLFLMLFFILVLFNSVPV
jgi:protoheme IX farnesyltransferase